MSFEIEISRKNIAFKVSGKLYNTVIRWEYEIDKAVFEEQLATGKFKNREIDNEMLTVMRMVKEKGEILPYYGAGGSRGACVYTFIPVNDTCQIIVNHSETNKVLELSASLSKTKFKAFQKHIPRFKYSILPFFISKDDLPDAWQTEPDEVLYCQIADQEYKNLKAWDNWNPKEAFTGRYKYTFGTVSLGNGFTIRVEDQQTGNTASITDIDSW